MRDISKLEVGDVLVADGHKLSFLVQNPFTGKPTRATLIGFLDWKSTALVGYDIMLEENTQSIASALRNAIINLQNIPKIVYQDNGRAFKAKYFINTDFKETGFEGIYAKLGIKTVFARPYNARAKVIERFFKEFQESFEKLLPTYSGSSIENIVVVLIIVNILSNNVNILSNNGNHNDKNCVQTLDIKFFRVMYLGTKFERILLWQNLKKLLMYLRKY